MTRVALLELRGAGGEPVDLRRTLGSHGVAELPPMAIDDDRSRRVGRPWRRPRVRGPCAWRGGRTAAPACLTCRVDIADDGPPPGEPAAAVLAAAVRRMLCLDDDL